jgi:hypothetical protein
MKHVAVHVKTCFSKWAAQARLRTVYAGLQWQNKKDSNHAENAHDAASRDGLRTHASEWCKRDAHIARSLRYSQTAFFCRPYFLSEHRKLCCEAFLMQCAAVQT